MANEVLFWHGEKIAALAAGRMLGMNNVNGSVAATGTLTGDGTNITALDTVTIDEEVYKFVAALTEAKAVGLLTGDSTNVANGDTVTVGGVVYTFQTALTNVAGHVLIGASAAASLTNLFHAINASGGTSGTDYAAACVANPAAVATNPSGTTVGLTAAAVGVNGNNTVTTETSAHLSFGATTLTGGVNSVANEVLKAGSAAGSLTHLYEAINAGSNKGTDYSSATVAHPSVVATNPSGTTVVVSASGVAQDGDTNDSIVTTEASTHLSWGAATLAGGNTADILVDPATGFPRFSTYALITPAAPSGDVSYALPKGDEAQEVTLYLKTQAGGNAVVTGAFVGGTTLTFSAVNQIAKLKFLNGSWLPMINTAALA
jgi:hypothetical protein